MTSSVNPAVPQDNIQVDKALLRANFLAIYNEITALQAQVSAARQLAFQADYTNEIAAVGVQASQASDSAARAVALYRRMSDELLSLQNEVLGLLEREGRYGRLPATMAFEVSTSF